MRILTDNEFVRGGIILAIRYMCRHCQTDLGEIDEQVSEDLLGFTQLSSDERADMISYEANGDITVRAICENCHESLLKNPTFYELDQIIH